jgi:hypothetical protein
MRKALFIFLLFPITVYAQAMNQQDMQNMMVQMQEMAACMQTVDQNEVEALDKDSKIFKAEMKELCNNGKRDEAQQRAIAYSRKVMSSQAFTTMRKCTENMPASMKGMMPNMDPEEIAKDFSKHHVCDEI